MTTTATPQSATTSQPAPVRPPLLQNGDHLTAMEFERRYSAMPNVKAELIEGIVYMASPIRARHHGKPHSHMIRWLGNYSVETPGVECFSDSTVRLRDDNVPQPDVVLMIDLPDLGRAKVGADGYIEGGPELVVEVAASTVSYDLHQKMRAYRENEVREYIAWRVEDDEIDWFVLRDGQYVRLDQTNGIFRSSVFPGLWLNAKALLEGDYKRFDATFREGVASPEHRAFVERLAAHKNAPPTDAK
ncbi:MAG: Uma2 family endonuclease [Gemmataceae bacterium]